MATFILPFHEYQRGYLGELLANPDTPDQDLPVLESIYIQTLPNIEESN